jgi:peptidyl-prolyl cis-trans isomerase D
MALISKIRRNFWIVLVLLGMALASFILMDVFGNRNGGFMDQTTLGKIDGKKVDVTDFNAIERALYSNAQDPYAAKSAVWDYLIRDNAASSVASALGIGVSDEELQDLTFNPNNLSPAIQNAFTNPQTGQLDLENLMQIKDAIDKGTDLSPDFMAQWRLRQNQVKSVSTQDKITNLVTKAMYTPAWMVDVSSQLQTETSNGLMLKVPFDYIADKDVKVTDEDYKNYLAENKGKFTNPEETRIIDFLAIDVVPTLADSAAVLDKLGKLSAEMRSTTNDSIFAQNNNGMLSSVYSKLDDFQGELKNVAQKLGKGEVSTPFIENGVYFVAKMVDSKLIPDSVKARHILRSTQGNVSRPAARAQIDSIRALIASGKQRFDSLAIKKSEDPGSAAKGGDLGVFAQGRMVKAFNDACFNDSKEGGLYTVETEFGVHLIEVQQQFFTDKNPKYKMALVSEPMVPSEETTNSAYDKVSKLLSENRTLENLKKSADKAGLTIASAPPVKANDFTFSTFGGGQTSRDIIKWAYEAKQGDVSADIHEYSDPATQAVKTYVIAGLGQVDPAGLMSVESAKKTLTSLVTNKKKGDIIAAKLAGSDLAKMASTVGIELDSINGVNYLAGAAELAGEPKVIATFTGLKEGKVSKPIIGSTGVYVVQPTSKTPGVNLNNLPFMKQNLSMSARSAAQYFLWPAIQKSLKIKDNRSRFY